MSALSRREALQVVAAAAVAPAVCVSRSEDPLAATQGARPIVAEMIKERFVPLPFEAQQLGGMLGERMRINVAGRLRHIDTKVLLDPFIHHHETDDFLSTWVGEHAGKFLDAACNCADRKATIGLRSARASLPAE